MRDGNQFVNTIVSLALVGGIFIGLVSLIAALFPLFSYDYIGAGMLLIASGLSFGLTSIAILVK